MSRATPIWFSNRGGLVAARRRLVTDKLDRTRPLNSTSTQSQLSRGTIREGRWRGARDAAAWVTLPDRYAAYDMTQAPANVQTIYRDAR